MPLWRSTRASGSTAFQSFPMVTRRALALLANFIPPVGRRRDYPIIYRDGCCRPYDDRSMTISDQDQAALRSFLERARHLEAHSLVQKNELRATWTLSMQKGQQATEDIHKVDYEALESILVRLRVFTMEKEPVFLPRMVNILKPHHRENIEFLSGITDMFLIKKEFGQLVAEAGGQKFTIEELFNNFIHARVFHKDSKKEERLTAFGNLLEDGFAYTMVLSAIVTKVNAVRQLRGFVEQNVALD